MQEMLELTKPLCAMRAKKCATNWCSELESKGVRSNAMENC